MARQRKQLNDIGTVDNKNRLIAPAPLKPGDKVKYTEADEQGFRADKIGEFEMGDFTTFESPGIVIWFQWVEDDGGGDEG